MKRHEVLAALAAAAGLTFAIPAEAGIASSAGNTVKPVIETLTDLQQQVSDSDQALSQMIHLAKAQGHDRGANGKSSGKGKSRFRQGPREPRQRQGPRWPRQGQRQGSRQGPQPSVVTRTDRHDAAARICCGSRFFVFTTRPEPRSRDEDLQDHLPNGSSRASGAAPAPLAMSSSPATLDSGRGRFTRGQGSFSPS